MAKDGENAGDSGGKAGELFGTPTVVVRGKDGAPLMIRWDRLHVLTKTDASPGSKQQPKKAS